MGTRVMRTSAKARGRELGRTPTSAGHIFRWRIVSSSQYNLSKDIIQIEWPVLSTVLRYGKIISQNIYGSRRDDVPTFGDEIVRRDVQQIHFFSRHPIDPLDQVLARLGSFDDYYVVIANRPHKPVCFTDEHALAALEGGQHGIAVHCNRLKVAVKDGEKDEQEDQEQAETRIDALVPCLHPFNVPGKLWRLKRLYSGHRSLFCLMQSVTDSLAKSSGSVLLLLIIGIIVLAVVAVVQQLSLKSQRGRIRSLLEGARGENIERMLYDQLKERVVIEDQLRDVRERLESLETRMLGSKRFMGLVRFDAFEDVGGSQSFALALYDERGEGMVISSLVGRADCRVYCKSLVAGRAERGLSAEEQEAIALAAHSKPQQAIAR